MKSKLILVILGLGIFSTLNAQFKFNPKEIEKIKLVLTKEFKAPFKLDELRGIDMVMDDKGDIKKVINDINIMKSVIAGEAEFSSCAALVLYLKNGSSRVFYGNGKRFNEIVNEKISGEYYTMTAWNIVEKHWDLKKEALCEN